MELQFFKIRLHQKFLFRVTDHFQLTLQSSLLKKKKELHTSFFNMEVKICIYVTRALVSWI